MEQNIKVKLPNGEIIEVPKGTSAIEILKETAPKNLDSILVAKVNNEIKDLTLPIEQDSEIEFLDFDSKEGKHAFWHTSAHIMAEAIETIYPGTKFGIGPAIENGFYYDIELPEGTTLSDKDFKQIEEKFMEIAKGKHPVIRKQVSKAEALKYYTEKNDPYKIELISELEDGTITFYSQNNFTDLCRGPHLPHTGYIKAFKILNIAGAYWRGDEKNKQLTRVYGISFPDKKMLQEYLQMIEEAKKRDHRKIGKELELFFFSENVGQGLPIWLPKGAALRERLENFLKKIQKEAGYQQVITPHIGNINLYKTSGHYAKYGKDSFQPINTPQEGEQFMLKPMNCPHHCEIYKSKPRSYRDLPLRLAEFGTVYRYEQSGELHGLTRVRGFTQDDAHIFCTPEQLKDEFKKVIDIVLHVFKIFNFKEFTAQISLRDPNDKEKYIGTEENWQKAEQAIIEAAQEKGLKAVVELGEAAFYGPKLDFMVKDALGRKWQLGTIQVDYNLPERFELEYIGPDNQKHRPVMIHRAPFGSMERFVAVLIEHTAGKFPLWLTPEQVAILPISEKFLDYSKNIEKELNKNDIRTYLDDRNEKIGKKIRESELMRIPYMLIIGEKEQEEGTVSVRRQGQGDIGKMQINEFITHLKEQIQKELNP